MIFKTNPSNPNPTVTRKTNYFNASIITFLTLNFGYVKTELFTDKGDTIYRSDQQTT